MPIPYILRKQIDSAVYEYPFLTHVSSYYFRVRIKRIAIAKCDPFVNYRDANVANSTKFAIPNFGRNISFLLFFFQVVTFSVLSLHFDHNFFEALQILL